jgi:hypothetical protein
MFYEKVFKTFKALKVKYLLGGGLAVNLHGVPRFTKDIDVLIDLSASNLNRLKKALEKLHYKPKIPVTMDEFLKPENWKKWRREKGMLGLSLYNPENPFEELDLLVNVELKFKSASKRKISLKSPNFEVDVIGIDDLIKMKLKAGRAQDKSDIIALRKVKKVKHEK